MADSKTRDLPSREGVDKRTKCAGSGSDEHGVTTRGAGTRGLAGWDMQVCAMRIIRLSIDTLPFGSGLLVKSLRASAREFEHLVVCGQWSGVSLLLPIGRQCADVQSQLQ